MAKFLVLWTLEQAQLSDSMAKAMLRMPEHGAQMVSQGKVIAR